MRPITNKQKQIYDFIVEFTSDKGYPPAIREICAAVSLKSPSSVHAHIRSLQEMGYIQKDDRKTRALSTVDSASNFGKIPILGRVTAGKPILAIEDVEGYLPYDSGELNGAFFALRVEGDSMINAGIEDGDILVVRKQQLALPGEIVVAMIDDEATVKRLMYDDGNIWLMPENDAYEPIDGNNCKILGTIKALYRTF